MATAQDLFIPSDPIDIPLGVLKGMVRNKPSTALPDAATFLLENFHADEDGPRRRQGSVTFAGGAVVTYQPVRDIFQMFNVAGSQKICILDKNFLYNVSGTNFVRQGWTYSAGSVRNTAAHVQGNATVDFSTAKILAGDYILLKPGVSQQELQIDQYIGKSQLHLVSAPVLTYPAGTAYKIFRSFIYVTSSYVDWCLCDNAVAFADGNRPMWRWDGATLSYWKAAEVFVPKAICYFMDRLWAFNTSVNDPTSGTKRRRVRWSTTLDKTNFGSVGSGTDTQWLDRPYAPGEGLRIVPMGKLLIAFYSDGIDVGRPTNIGGDTLPVAFERLETGGAGLVGMKAVCSFYDGLFCVLDDNVYSLSNSGLKAIGTPVFKEMTKNLKSLQGIQLVIDWKNDCLLVGVPDNNFQITKVWAYNYKSEQWSYDTLNCTALGNISQASGSTWDQQTKSWATITGQWDDFATAYFKQIAFGRSGAVALLDPDAVKDYDAAAIQATLETGDYQLEVPNQIKTALFISVKTDRVLESDVVFHVYGSTNRGTDWKSLGLLTIHAGEDEDDLTFRLTGSMLRFKLVCSSLIKPFGIAEVVLRVRKRGREGRFGPKD